MSALDFMERLLDGAEVEWRPLGALTTIKAGQPVSKRKIVDNPGEYPVINSGREPLGFISKWNTENDPIGITTRGTVGSITWQTGKYFRGNLNYSVTIKDESTLIVRYLYHLLLQMQSDIQSLCTFDAIPALNAGNLKQLPIPIPCPDDPEKSLRIQSEIVRILDTFTELTTELTNRKKQYNYYRDQLLSFEGGGGEWKPLEEIFEIKNGYTPSKKNPDYWTNGTIPWFRMDDIRSNGRILSDSLQHVTLEAVKKGNLFPANSLIIATTATIGEHALITVDSLANQRFTFLTKKVNCSIELDMKFMFYYGYVLGEWCRNNTNVASFASVDMKKFKAFKIPIPSIEEQQRIVTILDQFDALTHSISEGLPREIELRQKQYEYYRDLLFNFPKPEVIH